MHNNYYFLKHLTEDLKPILIGSTIIECFSQNKDELIIGIEAKGNDFFIKAHFSPSFCCLSFPSQFHRARKNSVTLFDDLLKQKITGITLYNNERAFSLDFENDYQLIFKLHGNRSNVLLVKNDVVDRIFINRLVKDLDIKPSELHKEIEQSKEAFIDAEFEIRKLFPTFDKHLINHYNDLVQPLQDVNSKWNVVQDILTLLSNNKYYVSSEKLSLLSFEGAKVFSNSIEALNFFFNSYISSYHLNKFKSDLLNRLNTQIKKGESYIIKNEQKLNQLQSDASYRVFGDLIMANLHAIPSGQKEIELANFYDNNNPITINLKRNLSPQKNAEIFYKKAKNQDIQVNQLKANIAAKKEQLASVKEQIKIIKEIEDFRQLKSLIGEIPEQKQDKEILPYNEYNYNGFVIWVGKNASANDKMLQKAFKDDLWLHAKDVSGSHVIIKYKSSSSPSAEVKEKAAQLAAYYSKRKTDSLCPVIITPKKFVRKRKGDPPGAVVVDKEEVLLVVPEKWT